MLGEANPVASGREDLARMIDSPDASIAREVNDIRGWVVLHEGTGAVWGVEPASQRHEKALPSAAEDLEEDRAPGSPVGRQRVLHQPEERAGRLWGEPSIEGRV